MIKEIWKLVHTETTIVCDEQSVEFCDEKQALVAYKKASHHLDKTNFHLERFPQFSEIVPENIFLIENEYDFYFEYEKSA